MKEHNFTRKVRPFNKCPASITAEDVHEINQLNEKHNETMKEYKKGDRVKI